MTQPSIHSHASGRTQELMGVLLADASVDVELVSRELGLTYSMSERLRRALDRLECVAGALQAMRCKAGGCESAGSLDASRRAIEEPSARWPQDYPADVVERLVLARKDGGELGPRCCDSSNGHLGPGVHWGRSRSQ
jgi:hypothetical protein